MSAKLEVKHGPFAGKTLDPHLGPSQSGITTVATVDAVQATQLFLETFPPSDGWSISLTGELLDLNMVPLANQLSGMDVHCPTALFKAALLKNGATVNQASTLWVLSGPTEWEKGETNARLRLYAAMGLPVRQDVGIVDPIITAKPKPTLVAIPTTPRQPEKAEPQAENATETKAQIEPEVVAVVDADEAEAPQPISAAASESIQPPAQSTIPLTGNPDAPNKALLENIRRICGMRGIAMPELATKDAAQEFLTGLLKRG